MSNKPKDTDFVQQRLKPIPIRFPTILLSIAILCLGIIFLPSGTKLRDDANEIYEKKITYDDGNGNDDCYIKTSNEGVTCQVNFHFHDNFDGPFYLYYQLSHFYQNHRRYYISKDVYQLQGQNLGENDVKLSCNPLYKGNNSNLLNPCGLIANSFFTDQFNISSSESNPTGLVLDETGISLKSDRDDLYQQVSGFKSAKDDGTSTCEVVLNEDSNCNSYTDKQTGQKYFYYYPDDDKVQYLYETYPNQISPIDGVEDEHFIVWMRTASMPTFRKLYGKIDYDFKKGDVLTIDVIANYEVGSFDGEKTLLLSNLGNTGGKNLVLGEVYIVIGSFSIIFGVILLIRDALLIYKN